MLAACRPLGRCAARPAAGGLSQRQLAGRAGVPPSTIARIERGRVEPTLDLLMRVVKACGLDLRMRLEVADGSADSTNSLDFESG